MCLISEIFDDGAQTLMQGLAKNTGMKRLVLWYNGLTDKSATHFARGLQTRAKTLPHWRNVMIQAIAESQPQYFFINLNNNNNNNSNNNSNNNNNNNSKDDTVITNQKNNEKKDDKENKDNNNNGNNGKSKDDKKEETSNNNKARPNGETYKICETIVQYLPIYMYFELDVTHNNRITKNGISELTKVANSQSIVVKGFKELLAKDRKEREAVAMSKTSFY